MLIPVDTVFQSLNDIATLHYLMRLAPIPENQICIEILQLLDKWRYQSLVTLFFSSLVVR